MINAIINGIFYIVQTLIAVVLAPIDLLLANIPSLTEAANGVAQLRTWFYNNLRFFMGTNGFLNDTLKTAIIGSLTAMIFFYNSQRAVSLIKLAYNWLQKIKFW